jgi:hypothetical protein
MLPRWMSAALCAQFPDLLWIAEPDRTSHAARTSMRLVCCLCPVQAECRAYVEERGIVSGFWAGSDRSPTAHAEREDGAA